MAYSRAPCLRVFLAGIIIGLCISITIAAIHLMSFQDNAYISSAPLISITSDTNTIYDHDDLSSAFHDRIKSPPNKIPLRLNASEIESQALKSKRQRGKYGGADIDQKHLGGFFHNDSNSYERRLWEWAIDEFDIKSILDVGCGIGYSTIFFKNHPSIERVLCIEGSYDAIQQSLVPNDTIQHDYTLGPFWPKESYDMLWCVEFLEHVEEKYMSYYMATFKKAKLLFITAAEQGGWHHSNVQSHVYWIEVFESYGFLFLLNITKWARRHSPRYLWNSKYSYHDLKPNGIRKYPYFLFTGLVFLNSLFLQSNVPRTRKVTLFDEMLLTQIHNKSHNWSIIV